MLAADRSRVLQNAQSLATKGQYDAAIAEWKKLLIESPNDGSIHNSVGDLHLKRNAISEAIAAFHQAAAGFRAEGATLKAIATYKKILKVDPTRYEVYRHLGDLNAERGLLSSAVQDYLTLGKHYLKERKSKEALEIYKKIVSQDPSNLDAQQRVAELCLQENLQDEATKVYLQLGRERSAQGRYDEAKDAYLAVLRIDPKNNEASQFVESVKKSGSATPRPAASNTATLMPKSTEPLDLLAEATRRMDEQQFAGAEAILNQLLTREPGNPQVCQLLARLHLQRGDVQVALGEYRFLAGAALRAQDYPLAEALINEFLTAEPNSVPLLELYAELYEEKGDQAQAAEQYAKAVELLLRQPEPGMESLHEELFEKVKALAPGSALVAKLTALMAVDGGQGPETDHTEAEAEAASPAVQKVSASAVAETPAPTAPAPSTGFSITGAEPDELPWAKPMAAARPENDAALSSAVPDDVRLVGQRHPDRAAAASAMWQGLPSEDEATPFHKAQAAQPQTDPEPVESVLAPRGAQDESVSAAPQAEQAVETAPETPVADYEAHYTLGIAYKNMGLYDDAMSEFQISKSTDSYYLDSCLMTALCLKEQHQFSPAIRGLEAVLSDPRCQGAKGQAIRYELGMLYEAESQWEKAVSTYQTIPSFHDVPQRLDALRGKAATTPAEFRLAS
ncbi:MAG: tetratricopeptide repeat protein [Nitrospira sp.]